MTNSLNIIFAGTPEFSVPCLSALIDAGHKIVAVYTQPDRPAGRGRKITASPVKQAALDAGLAVVQPASLKNEKEQLQLQEFNADLMVIVAYGLLLPAAVLEAPRLGCVNVHASLLPRWRGAAPIQRAILAGDETTGISIMQMNEGLDTGDVLFTKSCKIENDDTGASLHDRLMTLGAQSLLEVMPEITSGNTCAVAQDDTKSSYAAKLSRDDASIDWSDDAESIERQIRALNAWPVAQTNWKKKPGKPVEALRIWCASRTTPSNEGNEKVTPGTVLGTSSEGIDVATGDGVLRITELQSAGKKRLHASEFINAWRLEGQVFGISE